MRFGDYFIAVQLQISYICRFYIKTNNLWNIKKYWKYLLIKTSQWKPQKHVCTAMTWSIISNRHSETGRVWCHMGRNRAAEIGFYMSIKEMLTLLKQNGCQWGYAQMPSSSSYWLRDGRVLAKCSMGKKIRLVCEYIQVEATRKRRRRISFQHLWCLNIVLQGLRETDPGSALRGDFYSHE